MHLLSMIERYLSENGIPPSRFGRDAVGDPGLVSTLRRGREQCVRLGQPAGAIPAPVAAQSRWRPS